jgi:hypothetical protein
LGLGIDILTAVVIDSELFDAVVSDLVRVSAEGHVIANAKPDTAVGFPFTEESIQRLLLAGYMGHGPWECCLSCPGVAAP